MKREVEEVKEREGKSDNLKEKKKKLAERSLPISEDPVSWMLKERKK